MTLRIRKNNKNMSFSNMQLAKIGHHDYFHLQK